VAKPKPKPAAARKSSDAVKPDKATARKVSAKLAARRAQLPTPPPRRQQGT
jgi:hypothetical protein